MKNIYKMSIFCLTILNLNSSNYNSQIVSPRMASVVNTDKSVIIGLLQNNSKPICNKPVTIYIDDIKVAVVPTDNKGVWSYRLKDNQKLNDGIHFVQVSTNLNLNNINWSKGIFFTVQTSKTCDKIFKSGNVNLNNSSINFPFEGSYINTTLPIVVGSLLDSNFNPVSNETVNIKIDSNSVGNTTSNNNGVFSYELSSGLSEANHTVGATCIESSVNLNTNNFVVDVTNPDAPGIISPTENSIISNNSVIVTGTSESLATITTFVDNDTYGDVSYGDETGNWSIEYTLNNGAHSVKAQASDLANNTGAVSPDRNFTVNG